jgi:hypothetical protein
VSRSIYKEYVLSCRASQLDGGGFRATVALICMGGEKTRSQHFLDLDGIFSTEAEANDRARCAGIDWIETNAEIVSSTFYPTRFLAAEGPRS